MASTGDAAGMASTGDAAGIASTGDAAGMVTISGPRRAWGPLQVPITQSPTPGASVPPAHPHHRAG